MKRCYVCKEKKPLTEFYRCKSTADGLQTKCKSCGRAEHRRYREKNPEKFTVYWRRHSFTRCWPFWEFIIAYLRAHPCVDCGERDIVVLDFDHLDPKAKSFNIGTYVAQGRGSIELVKAEIEKCDVVCANCHRRRTALRANSYRALYQLME